MKAMARRLAPATRTTVRRSQALYTKTPHRSMTRMPAAVKAIWQLVRKIMWSNRCCATSHLLTSTTAQLDSRFAKTASMSGTRSAVPKTPVRLRFSSSQARGRIV